METEGSLLCSQELVTGPWYDMFSGYRWSIQPSDMEGSCKYIE
jgi:hypothetical protein